MNCGHEEATFHALRVCANLAKLPEQRRVLVQAGAVGCALRLSEAHDARIRSHAAGMLANLSLDESGTSAAAMLQEGAAVVLTSLLTASEPEVQRSSCLALANFVTTMRNTGADTQRSSMSSLICL